jgi:glycosyltransferase involved in cell wall biosynthesis
VQVSTLPDFLLLAAQPVRLRGAKVVSFIKEPSPELGRTIYDNSKWDIPLKAFEQLAIRLADMVFTVTDELRETLVGRGAKELRTHVVMNGGGDEYWVSDRDDLPVPDPKQFTVICHGTIEHRYGHDTILDAGAILADEMPELRLTLCGEGSYSSSVKQGIIARGLDEIVTFHGFVSHDDLIDHIHRADVGIVAQLASSYSHLVNTNKMFEYIMLRRPVIATRLRSVSSTFSDAEIEFYDPGSGEGLAQAIRNLRHDSQRRESLVSHAGVTHQSETSWSIQRDTLLREVIQLARTSKWWKT